MTEGWHRILNSTVGRNIAWPWSFAQDTSGLIYFSEDARHIFIMEPESMTIIDSIVMDMNSMQNYLAVDKNNKLWIWGWNEWMYSVSSGGYGEVSKLSCYDPETKVLSLRKDVFYDSIEFFPGQEDPAPDDVARSLNLLVTEDNILMFVAKDGIFQYDIDAGTTKCYSAWHDSLKHIDEFTSKPYPDSIEYASFWVNPTIWSYNAKHYNIPHKLNNTNNFFHGITIRYPEWSVISPTVTMQKGYRGIVRYNYDNCVADHKIFDFMDIYGTRGTSTNAAQDDPIDVYLLPYPNIENDIYILVIDKVKREQTVMKYNPIIDDFEPTNDCHIKVTPGRYEQEHTRVPWLDSSGHYIFNAPFGAMNENGEWDANYIEFYDQNREFIKRVYTPWESDQCRIIDIIGNKVFVFCLLAGDDPDRGLYWFDASSLVSIKDSDYDYIDVWIDNVYPNPANKKLDISVIYSSNYTSFENFEVSLYNSIGEKVLDITPLGSYSESRNRFEASINIPPSLPTGIYIVTAKCGNIKRTRSVVIMK